MNADEDVGMIEGIHKPGNLEMTCRKQEAGSRKESHSHPFLFQCFMTNPNKLVTM